VSCAPERVTGFVDGELAPAEAAALAAHLETCDACRAQAEAERGLRARLRALPLRELPSGLEARVRSARPGRAGVLRAARRLSLPLAAVLVLGVFLRGHASVVAWDLARDHDKCFSRRPLPAAVVSGDPEVVGAWFAERGTRLPRVPAAVGELRLVGARYCPLATLAEAPHLYYASAESHVSIFVVPHRVRLADRLATRARGDAVRLLRLEGEVVGLVGEREADVGAFESELRPLMAAWRGGR